MVVEGALQLFEYKNFMPPPISTGCSSIVPAERRIKTG